MTRALVAFVAFVASAVLVAVAVDAGRWQHVGTHPPSTLVGGVAENLLATHDDVTLRRVVASFVAGEQTPVGFDNGRNRARVRAEAEAQLAEAAAALPRREAAQADNLLGILAWGSTKASDGVLDPADRAVNAFTEAARLDPGDTAAAFNLELALRSLAAQGARRGASPNSSSKGIGHSGAGSGAPGEGY
jgi:hypothetical protein